MSFSEPGSVSTFSEKCIVNPKYVLDYVRHMEVKDSWKQKRMEDNAREAEDAKSKTLAIMHDWEGLMREEKNLKKLSVHELVEYVIYHSLKRV